MRKELFAEFARAAKAQGVGQLRFHVEETAERSTSVYGGELERLNLAESCRFLIEGEAGGFAGSVFADELRPELIGEYVRQIRESALEGKRPFQAHPLASLPEPEGAERSFLPLEELVEKMVSAGNAALAADSRVKLQGCNFRERYGTVTLMDGEGHSITDRVGGNTLHIGLTAHEGEVTQLGGRGEHLPWGELPDLETLARDAAHDVVSRLDAASYPTGPSPVVLDSKVVCELLDAFAPSFFGNNVQKHMSVLENRLGQAVAGENVSLLEEPQLEGGLRCRRFDDEGTPTSAKKILENGVLRTYLHNWQSAAREGAVSSGNGFQHSFSEEVTVGYTNLVLERGEKSQEQLLADLGDGLLITHVSGVFAGARPTTGEFSLIAQGYQVRGGRLGRAVTQITIAGDFFEMLRQVRGVGCDVHWMHAPNGCVCAPSLHVASLAVSGGD